MHKFNPFITSIHLLFKQYSVILIHFIVHLGMFLSASVHSLWFEKNNHIENFSLSFTVMASVGLCSTFISIIVSTLPFGRAFFIGNTLYGLGLICRCYATPTWIPILSGIITGIGLNIFYLTIKLILYHIPDEERRKKSIADFRLAKGIAQYFGLNLGTMYITYTQDSPYSYLFILCISGGIVCISPIFYLFNQNNHSALNRKEESREETWIQWSTLKSLYKEEKKVLLFILSYNLACSLFISLTIRYLPIILKESGGSIVINGSVIANSMLFGAILQGVISRTRLSNCFLSGYIVSNLLLGTSLFFISISNTYIWTQYGCILLFYTFLSLSGYYEKMIEITIFSKKHASILFGISQSTYLLGEMVGVAMGGIMIAKLNQATLLHTSSLGVLISLSIGSYILMKHHLIKNKI